MKKVRRILLAVMGALAVQGFSEPFRVLNPEAKSIKSDVKVELGEGCGETREEALQEALKDVLQKVVGVYVDSDFRMNNDEIIKDQIITHSNGFIEKYTVLDEADEENGRGKVVTIRARVKIREVFNRIKKIVPTQTVAVDGALVSNEVENQLNAEKLLRNLLEDFDIRSIMEIKLADSIRPEIQSSKDGVVVMRYAFVVKYSDQKYYKEFLPRLDHVMNQIAKGKPKMCSEEISIHEKGLIPSRGISPIWGWNGHSVTGREYYGVDCIGLNEETRRKASVVVEINQDGKNGGIVRLKEWPLSDYLLRLFVEMRDKTHRQHNGRLMCEVKVLNKQGDDLASSVIDIPILTEKILPPVLRTICLARVESSGRCSHCYYNLDKFVGFIDVPINQSDLSKIKSVQIKLITKNEGEEE